MDGQASSGLRGIRCHRSSVTYGMNGCSNFNPASKAVYSVFWAEILAGDSSLASNNGLVASYLVSSARFISLAELS